MYSHPEGKSLCNYGVLCIGTYKKAVKKRVVQKEPSRLFRKARLRACLPDTITSPRKQVSHSTEDINWLISM